jgi:hypothetical protein
MRQANVIIERDVLEVIHACVVERRSLLETIWATDWYLIVCNIHGT